MHETERGGRREADDQADEAGEDEPAECNASHRMTSTATSVTPRLAARSPCSVANSSSDSGTGPVSRTLAPNARRAAARAAVCRIALVAAWPGSSALKSRIGCDLDEAAQLAGVGRLALDQDAPREARLLSGEHAIERVAGQIERSRHLVELEMPALHPHGAELQRIQHAPQARIGGKRAEQGLRPGELARGARELLLAEIEQPVLLEEFAATRHADRFQDVAPLGQARRQRHGRLLDVLRRRRLDHDENQLGPLRERALELRFLLAPGELRRNQVIDVGIDGEMPDGVDGCRQRDQKGDHDHRPAAPGREINDSRNDRSKHAMTGRGSNRSTGYARGWMQDGGRRSPDGRNPGSVLGEAPGSARRQVNRRMRR